MYRLEGGSIGFQIGGEATDFVLLVMNDRGVSSLLNSKVKLGADFRRPRVPRAVQPKPVPTLICARKCLPIRGRAALLQAYRLPGQL